MPDAALMGQMLLILAQVVMIDLVLAGDNAIVIGMAAVGLNRADRHRAILTGIIAATVLRIIFALTAIHLLNILGLLLIGGILLLWVSWKMYREIMTSREAEAAAVAAIAEETAPAPPRKTLRAAVMQIVIADVSMSLDNVLAVAGAAREHPVVMGFGLILSIGLMGLTATLVARVLQRWHWLAYVGLGVILYVALDMIWRGAHDVWPAIAP